VSLEPARDAEAGAGPGALLRRAREAAGLSEQQAAEQLNLDSNVVAALERDDLAALGAPVFAKGHLRRYGALLGVPEADLLGAYGRARAQPETPTLIPKARVEMSPVRGRPKWPWVLGGAFAFVVAAGLAAYVSEYGVRLPPWPWAGSDTTQPSAGAPAAPPQSAPGSNEPAPVMAQETVTAAPAATGTTAPVGATPVAAAAAAGSTAATGGRLPPLPAGHVSMTLSFAADSWVEIYDGAGQAVLYDLGRAGSQRVVTGAAPLSVTLGNAPTVTLVVNGRAARLPAVPAGQTVARFSIQADGSLR
jgi:cytoskeleton protein RodZ